MIVVNFDGGCGPRNPGGKMAYAAIITTSSGIKIKLRRNEDVNRRNSNNVAEYLGLLLALDWLITHGHCSDKIRISGDSKLVINQMSGKWRIKKGLYKDQALKALEKTLKFKSLTWCWVPRELNITTDQYARSGNLV